MKAASRMYRGWWVHMGLFLSAAAVIGSSSYTFGLFVVPVSTDLGISRADINNGFIALLLGVAVMSPGVGRLLDTVSARRVMLSGALAYGAGLILMTQVESHLLMLALILGPISFGYAACGTLAVNTVIVRWFKRRRGSALGIMAVSTSTGGFIFAPLTAMFIDDFSWRTALLVNGSIAITAVALLSFLLIRNAPDGTEAGYTEELEDLDLKPDTADRTPSNQDRIWSYADLIRSRNFWCLAIGIGLLLASDQAMVTATVPNFLDIGIDIKAAAFIVSCMTASAIAGKLMVGYLADKVDLRYVFFGVAVAHIALQLVYIAEPGYWILLCLATVFGVAIGGVFPVWSTLLAWLFGTRSYGSIMGAMMIIGKGLSMIAVRIIGRVRDATGSYEPALFLFIGAVMVAMFFVYWIKPSDELKNGSLRLA